MKACVVKLFYISKSQDGKTVYLQVLWLKEPEWVERLSESSAFFEDKDKAVDYLQFLPRGDYIIQEFYRVT